MKNLLVSTLIFALFASSSHACTTIIVGKAASADGSIIVGRNVDAPNAADWASNFVYHPPGEGGYVVQSVLENQFSYQMPLHVLGYSGFPQPNTGDLSFEEAGFNDAGVGISATETIFSNARTLAVDPYNKKTGVVEEIIPSVVLPQIRSAREGVKLLGKLIETYGSGEGFGVAFVDKDEAWYLENAGGHQWLAARIPDNAYFVSANQSRLGEADLSDSDHFLSSPNLVRFAEENGLFDPQSSSSFSFRKVFGKDEAGDADYNYSRVGYLQGKYTSGLSNKKYESNSFPTFVKPDRKISIADVRDSLRSYNAGTENDPYSGKNSNVQVRPISVYRAYQSHIMQVRSHFPEQIANVQYLDLGMTALGIYVPFYQGATIPDSYRHASIAIDSNSAAWKYRKVQLLAMQDFQRYEPMVRSTYDRLEQEILVRQRKFEEDYKVMVGNNPRQAQALLDEFTRQNVNDAFAASSELEKKIMNDMSIQVYRKYRFRGA
ncbi:C69 family dipeptidase [Paraburkholderia xenovorans]|uniref:C69 family dipeptidase n=1 Tax=Paraburkholderia xenovorans TaxID=36873 RepID=UPI0038BD898C